jgi:flagellar biogenesis protein FliO
MTATFLGSYALGLAAIGLMLFGLYAAVRAVRGRGSRGGRLVRVIESSAISPSCALHVVVAGERYLLIGSGPGQVTMLAELDAPKNT